MEYFFVASVTRRGSARGCITDFCQQDGSAKCHVSIRGHGQTETEWTAQQKGTDSFVLPQLGIHDFCLSTSNPGHSQWWKQIPTNTSCSLWRHHLVLLEVLLSLTGSREMFGFSLGDLQLFLSVEFSSLKLQNNFKWIWSGDLTFAAQDRVFILRWNKSWQLIGWYVCSST